MFILYILLLIFTVFLSINHFIEHHYFSAILYGFYSVFWIWSIMSFYPLNKALYYLVKKDYKTVEKNLKKVFLLKTNGRVYKQKYYSLKFLILFEKNQYKDALDSLYNIKLNFIKKQTDNDIALINIYCSYLIAIVENDLEKAIKNLVSIKQNINNTTKNIQNIYNILFSLLQDTQNENISNNIGKRWINISEELFNPLFIRKTQSPNNYNTLYYSSSIYGFFHINSMQN